MNMERIHVESKEGFSSEVKISSDVIATIVALAVTEVEGIAALSGNLTNEFIGKLGIKNVSKGVQIVFAEDKKSLSCDIDAVMKYGYSIPETSQVVQEKVKSAVESMVGVKVDSVNLNIVGVDTDAQ